MIKKLLYFISPLYPLVFLACLGLIIVSWLIEEPLPDPENIDTRLHVEPIQKPTNKAQFNVSVGGVEYYIKPLYTYELYGLVVSMHTAGKNFSDRAHRRWGDHINTADLCVIWGKNALSGIYTEMKFTSGQWTCFWNAKNGDWHSVANKFDNNQISNNHMLVADSQIARTLNSIRIGDQIHLKGYLAEYGTVERMIRSTSTTRTDTGNGACETVFTTEISIIKGIDRTWWFLPWLGFTGLVILFTLWCFTPTRRIYEYEKASASYDEHEDNSLYARQRRRRK